MEIPTEKEIADAFRECLGKVYGEDAWDNTTDLSKHRIKARIALDSFCTGVRWKIIENMREKDRLTELEQWAARVLVWMGTLERSLISDLEYEGKRILSRRVNIPEEK